MVVGCQHLHALCFPSARPPQLKEGLRRRCVGGCVCVGGEQLPARMADELNRLKFWHRPAW